SVSFGCTTVCLTTVPWHVAHDPAGAVAGAFALAGAAGGVAAGAGAGGPGGGAGAGPRRRAGRTLAAPGAPARHPTSPHPRVYRVRTINRIARFQSKPAAAIGTGDGADRDEGAFTGFRPARRWSWREVLQPAMR